MSILTAALLSAFTGLGSPGATVMPVLGLDQGPRLAAMGGAGIALADDAGATYWNPARLGLLTDRYYALSHQQWFGGINDEVVHFGLPSASGTVGLGVLYSAEPGIESWTEGNQPGDTFGTWDGVLALAYGLEVAPGYAVGGAVKGFYNDLYSSMGYGGALDVGFSCRPLSFLSLGAVGRNMGAARYGSGMEQLPVEAGVGAGLRLGSFSAGLDGVASAGSGLNARVGGEWRPLPELAVRLGYRTGPQDIATLGWASGLTAGVGVNVAGFSVDYALTPYGQLGLAHRIGVQVRLPRKGEGRVRIRTVEEGTLAPVWATLKLDGLRSLSVPTDRTGMYTLDHLAAGTLVIEAGRDGYEPRVDTLYVVGDREQWATIALTPLQYGDLSGVVFDADTRKPLAGKVTYAGRVEGTQDVDPELGSYTLKHIPSGQYVITATGPGPEYVAQVCTLTIKPSGSARQDFYVVRGHLDTGPSSRPVLENVLFESGRTDVPRQAEMLVARAAGILKERPSAVIELAGHTDGEEGQAGTSPSNWELSQARAEAVRKMLVEVYGIPRDRITAHGYADTQPIAGNDTHEGMAKNRRVEFRITGQ